MRYLVVIVLFYLLVIVITSVCKDASSAPSLVFHPGRRAIEKWSLSYKNEQGDHSLKSFSLGSIKQAAGRGVKSTNQENSNAYSTEKQNSSSKDVEDIVYHIDYHGATTHPTPTPKHPKP
ncbi:hypothetical protein ACH5RR_006286 [Cinchona calisaya]|uniref:Uncharacterized protein n=1 Tax=Cinchona calisaya TaxID=153742 RepID=A0ABD3ANL7_9GENT